MIPWLGPHDPFPPVDRALREPNGLLAAGRTLAVPTLLDAYSRGLFPWFNEDEPILWWSPDPRMILRPPALHVSASLRKRLRRRDYEVRADTSFAAVIQGCAAPRPEQPGTWITRRMIAAYVKLHEAGHAHSIETWIDGALAGGLYGVAIGRAFFGESMFATRSDASKIAFVHLVRQLERWGFGLIDCQMKTTHLGSLGAEEIPRRAFAAEVARLVAEGGRTGAWALEPGLVDPPAPRS
jgi:leucyl/phenylalanyl-tRNA---protein transferase